MPNTPDVLTLGKPRFADADLAHTAAGGDLRAAWESAFSRFGWQAANRVSGDFAVALRQARSDGSETVFLAADRFSVHTLCYRLAGDRLLFAERADDLADADVELDPQALYDYIYYHCIPAPRTLFEGVFRLPPAHYALFENGKLTVAPYWTPAFEEKRPASFETLKEEFLSIVKTSVADQLDGGMPACFLSGGTDSSTVAGMLTRICDQPVNSYSIGFEAEGYDEMEYARLAARHFGTQQNEYYVTPADLVAGIPGIATHFDQPFGNSSALPAYYCAKVARADGANKLLAGDGGDELFGGNARYAKQKVFGYYEGIPAALRRALIEPVSGLPGLGSVPLVKKGVSYVEQAKVPMPDRLQMYNLLNRLGVENLLTPAFLACVDQDAPRREQAAEYARSAGASLVNRMLAFDWKYTLADSDLPKVNGATGMAGVDVGFPLLDYRLLDFSLKLEPELKVKGLTLRWFFKEALRGFLPDEILTKKKHGFGLPFGVWAVKDPALNSLVRKSLDALAGRGLIRPDFIRKLVDENLPAYPGYYGEMVWILVVLEQWLEAKRPNWRMA